MKLNITLAIIGVIITALLSSGIIRHDVSKEAYLEFTGKEQFDYAGMVLDGQDNLGGSCTLIGKRAVLTAAHLSVVRNFDAQTDTLYCQFKDQKYRVERVLTHPAFVNTLTRRFGDIALLILGEDVADIKPSLLYNKTDELGATAALVGFGSFGKGMPKGSRLLEKPRKLAGQNTIDSVGGEVYPGTGSGSTLFADFDHPSDTACCNRMGSPVPLPLEFMVAAGDSGGGLFIKDKGEWRLAGIASGMMNFKHPSNYGIIGYWTRVSSFREWIQQAHREYSPEDYLN